MGILAAEAFEVRSTHHRTQGKSPGQLVFGRDMILTINHVADWSYIYQRKQAKINKYVIGENTTRIDNDYRVGDKALIRNLSQHINAKPCSKARMKNFKCGQTEPPPYIWERLQRG